MLPSGLTAAHANPSSTGETAGPYLTTGPNSCVAWTAARRAGEAEALSYEQWILGFLSGVGFAGNPSGFNPLNGVAALAVLAWVDDYCQAHPLDELATAGAEFAFTHPH